MKIATIGCSWTSGIYRNWSLDQSAPDQKKKIPNEDFVCWPRELGKLKPKWQIDNFAIPASNALLGVYILDQIKSQYDKVIFQVTTADRYTSWSEDTNFSSFLEKYAPNVRMFTPKLLSNIILYDFHYHKPALHASNESLTVNSVVKKENKFINYYYYRTTNEMFNINHKALISYAKQNADIVFSHVKKNFCDSIEDILGEEQFDKFTCDWGRHFGIEGAQWQAKWILDQINSIRGCTS
jgi:hypothetical protein